ncbi:MAG: hypothetical protein RL272_269 [Candidatus Parcubacteria bacterium]|jgi:hemerythrin
MVRLFIWLESSGKKDIITRDIITIIDRNMPFTWTQQYSVGIDAIDKQHQHFFAMAAELEEIAATRTWDRARVLNLFREFAVYAEHHLETEEMLFEKYHYPDAARHRAEHDEYRRQVKLKVMAVMHAGADLYPACIDMARFSAKWLKLHIIDVDQHYSKFLIAAGADKEKLD